jgi:hypothetical protein
MAIGSCALAVVAATTIDTLRHISPRGSSGCVDGDPFNHWAGPLALLALLLALVAVLAAGTGQGGKGAWWLAAVTLVAAIVGGLYVVAAGYCNITS